ncbi:hypothetical protein ES705_23335 [subsurface metagenome]
MILKENIFTEAYEQLRKRMLNNGNKIENQSQLVFLTQGMFTWLQTIRDIKIFPHKQHRPSSPSIYLNIKQAAVSIITDMVLEILKAEVPV